MKWQHWLVWGLLASGAIGLGACAAPEVKALRAEIKMLRERLAVKEKLLLDVRYCPKIKVENISIKEGEMRIDYEFPKPLFGTPHPREVWVILSAEGQNWHDRLHRWE